MAEAENIFRASFSQSMSDGLTPRIGIAGESECGKSTLAKALSREIWRVKKIPSLIYDPRKYSWGNHAWVSGDESDWRAAVEKKRGCLVIIEDASETINRDREFSKFFTCIRHQLHWLMVLCHDATDLLRPMRRNLNELYLFNQTPDAVEMWKESQPSMRGLELSIGLPQFTFIHSRKFSQTMPTPSVLKI